MTRERVAWQSGATSSNSAKVFYTACPMVSAAKQQQQCCTTRLLFPIGPSSLLTAVTRFSWGNKESFYLGRAPRSKLVNSHHICVLWTIPQAYSLISERGPSTRGHAADPC